MGHDKSSEYALSFGDEPTPCSSCAVRNSSLCVALSVDELHDLNVISHRKTLAPGQHHVFEGDQVRDFANVTNGVAKLVRSSEDGRMQIVGLLFPSDFIGGAVWADSDGHNKLSEPYSIEAVSEVELCVFSRREFHTLLRRYPSLEHTLLERTMSELQIARDWMFLLGRKTAEERVATFLFHVSDRIQTLTCKGTQSFDLPLGRADIADYVELTIETVSRQISKLRKAGVIEMQGNRHVVAIDRDRLGELAGY